VLMGISSEIQQTNPIESGNWPAEIPGPDCYSDLELLEMSETLLGTPVVDINQLTDLAANAVASYKYRPETGSPLPQKIFLHDGTPQNRNWETDFGLASQKQRPQDLAGYTNIRALGLASPGDLMLSRGAVATEVANVRAAAGEVRKLSSVAELTASPAGAADKPNMFVLPQPEISDRNLYYLSHSLLQEALKHQSGRSSETIELLLAAFSSEQPPVVSLYTLDKPFQLFLTWLHTQVNLSRQEQSLPAIEKISVEANSPEVGERFNTKLALHPDIEVARATDLSAVTFAAPLLNSEGKVVVPQGTSYKDVGWDYIANVQLDERSQQLLANTALQVLRQEHQASAFGELFTAEAGAETQTNEWLPTLPGYAVRLNGDRDNFWDKIETAARLLQRRYGLSQVRLKLAKSSDGDGVSEPIAIADILGRRGYRDKFLELTGGAFTDLVVEANGAGNFQTLSAHIVQGTPSQYITREIFHPDDKRKWVGNYVARAQNAPELLELPASAAREVSTALSSLSRALERHPRYSQEFVTAGFDFASCQLGGVFGQRQIVGVVDANVRFTGALPIRHALDSLNGHAGNLSADLIMGRMVPYHRRPDYQLLEKAVTEFRSIVNLQRSTQGLKPIAAKIIFHTAGAGMFSVTGASIGETSELFSRLENHINERVFRI
jgi:hypothetical protein